MLTRVVVVDFSNIGSNHQGLGRLSLEAFCVHIVYEGWVGGCLTFLFSCGEYF